MVEKIIVSVSILLIVVAIGCASKKVQDDKTGSNANRASASVETRQALEQYRESIAEAATFDGYTAALIGYAPGVKETVLHNLGVYKDRNAIALGVLKSKGASKKEKHGSLSELIFQTKTSLKLQEFYLSLMSEKLVSDLNSSVTLLENYLSEGKYGFAVQRIKSVNDELALIEKQVEGI